MSGVLLWREYSKAIPLDVLGSEGQPQACPARTHQLGFERCLGSPGDPVVSLDEQEEKRGGRNDARYVGGTHSTASTCSYLETATCEPLTDEQQRFVNMVVSTLRVEELT